jgi:hypothetical protein
MPPDQGAQMIADITLIHDFDVISASTTFV